MESLIAVTVVLSVAAALFALWRYTHRPRWRCPNCGSRQVGLIRKDPQGLRSVDMHTGGSGGGYSGIQTTYAVTYQCNHCHFRWTDTIVETT